MCYRTGKYAVCRHALQSFSWEILQAGATMGLKLAFAFNYVFGSWFVVLGCVSRNFTYALHLESLNTMLVLLSIQMFQPQPATQFSVYRYLMHSKWSVTHMHTRMHACTHTCMHARVHTHTHTHTHWLTVQHLLLPHAQQVVSRSHARTHKCTHA